MVTNRSSRKRSLRILMGAVLGAACFSFLSSAGDRPAMPAVTQPVMFNTPEADRILAALQVFPPDNPWNEDISKLPVLKNSEAMIATIGPQKKVAYNLDMNFVLVPGDQERVEA